MAQTMVANNRSEKEKRQDNRLGFLRTSLLCEAVLAWLMTNSWFATEYGKALGCLNVCLKLAYYLLVFAGWLYAQCHSRPHYFVPFVLKTVYLTFYGATVVVFLNIEQGSSETCGWLQKQCLFLLQFPYNLFRSEENGVFCHSMIFWEAKRFVFAVFAAFQLLQLYLVIKCWKYISSPRRDTQHPPRVAVSVSRVPSNPLDSSSQLPDLPELPEQEAVTPKSDPPPSYKDVTRITNDSVTADGMPPTYEDAIANCKLKTQTNNVPK